MPRSQEQNAQIRDKRRKNILEKSLVLFSCVGVDAVTVDDIARATNCSHGLFYHYFDSKADVFKALLREKNKEYAAGAEFLDAALQAEGTKGLQILCDRFQQMLSSGETDFSLAHLLLTNRFASAENPEGSIGNALCLALQKLIREGQQEGLVHTANPEILANMFMDYCDGAIQRRALTKRDRYEIPPAETMMMLFLK